MIDDVPQSPTDDHPQASSCAPLPAQSTLGHFTPLRYPGGKARLAPFLKQLLRANHLLDGEYVEPYAGGAGVALELLMQGYVSHIHINDLSRPVYAFWRCVLSYTHELCRRIRDTPRTVAAWDDQKRVLMHPSTEGVLSLGFAAFYLNRTNRSGILNGGIIGGRDQAGEWKIDARYNAEGLIRRIEAIAARRKDISLTQKNALTFLKNGVETWPAKTLVYLDPPYYVKGRDLYPDYYKHDDHVAIANFVRKSIRRQHWIVSYDNAPQIQTMYAGERRAIYDIGYSARSTRTGREVMFFSKTLEVPSLVGAIKLVEAPETKTKARTSARSPRR